MKWNRLCLESWYGSSSVRKLPVRGAEVVLIGVSSSEGECPQRGCVWYSHVAGWNGQDTSVQGGRPPLPPRQFRPIDHVQTGKAKVKVFLEANARPCCHAARWSKTCLRQARLAIPPPAMQQRQSPITPVPNFFKIMRVWSLDVICRVVLTVNHCQWLWRFLRVSPTPADLLDLCSRVLTGKNRKYWTQGRLCVFFFIPFLQWCNKAGAHLLLRSWRGCLIKMRASVGGVIAPCCQMESQDNFDF